MGGEIGIGIVNDDREVAGCLGLDLAEPDSGGRGPRGVRPEAAPAAANQALDALSRSTSSAIVARIGKESLGN